MHVYRSLTEVALLGMICIFVGDVKVLIVLVFFPVFIRVVSNGIFIPKPYLSVLSVVLLLKWKSLY